MPSGYLHKRCAEKAVELSGVTIKERDALVLGAQGPDPLFMLGIFPLGPSSRPGPLGNLLHTRRTGAFLCALCRRAKDGSEVERAYAMGFLTHYALDSTVHPYVYAHSVDKHGKYSSLLHMRLEKRWDTLFYRQDGHRSTPVIMPGVAETRPVWEQIADLWAVAINDVFPEECVTRETVLKALGGAERVNRLTHSPSGVKYGAVWVLERVIGKAGLATSQMAPRFLPRADITNADHAQWRAPAYPDTPRDEGLMELYDRAVKRATELLTAARGYFGGTLPEEAFAAAVGNAQYDTGMESDA